LNPDHPAVPLSNATQRLIRQTFRSPQHSIMTAFSRILLPTRVTLSAAKGLSRWPLRCFASAQHDRVNLLPRLRHLKALCSLSHLKHLMGFLWLMPIRRPSRSHLLTTQYWDYSPTLLTFHIQNFLLFHGIRYTEFNGY